MVIVFKKQYNSVRSVFDVAKKSFFSTEMKSFLFLISYFYHLICFIKKEIYHKMQREKLCNFVNTVCCGCFQKGEILCNPFSYGQNLVAQSSIHFENKKCKYRKKQSYVNCRAIHAASYDVFCFLIKRIR